MKIVSSFLFILVATLQVDRGADAANNLRSVGDNASNRGLQACSAQGCRNEDNPTSQTTLTLINADTDADVRELYNRSPIFTQSETPRWTVRVNIDPSFANQTQSVKFVVDGQVVRIEHMAPYALAGNSGPDYFAYYPKTTFTEPGMVKIQAIPYSGKNATGAAGPAATVSPMILFS